MRARALNSMMSVSSFFTYPIADKDKVLLYNFFEDSTATSNQWRLVLNRISNGVDLSDVPTFDETRHASICIEVRYSWLEFSLPSPLMLPAFTVEVLVRCNYSGSEQPLDRGWV